MKKISVVALAGLFVVTGLCMKNVKASEGIITQEPGAIVKGISDESFFFGNEYGGILGFSASKSKFLFKSNEYIGQLLREVNNSGIKQGKNESQNQRLYGIFEETKQILSETAR